jgi:glucosylceramidase
MTRNSNKNNEWHVRKILIATAATLMLTQMSLAGKKESGMSKSSEKHSITVVITAKDTQDRLTTKTQVELSPSDANSSNIIQIDTSKTFQQIEGFGGAFTEAAAYTLSRLSPDKRQEALKAYFDPKDGIGYTLCRTHINSCDFSLKNYAYDEVDGDTELKNFDISRDKKWLIPMIKDALAVRGAKFNLFASPWSPPAWMKSNNEMNHGGNLLPQYRDTWALYFSKYIEAYAAEGINMWGITVQNEPEAVQTWDSCIWTPQEEGDFIRDHLGPTLAKNTLGHVKIMIWDHNKDRIYERAVGTLSDPNTAKYVWGVAFHWYSGDQFENLDKTHKAFPDKKLLFTEGCLEGGTHFNDWRAGERYGHDIIGDLNNWTVGWVDWNMVLDERGGPNHVNNLCDAPIIADTVHNKLIYENSYYYMGHFSKFIRPGAVRIGCATTNNSLETTAFKNTDGKIVVIVMNRTDNAVDFVLKTADADAKINSPAHSIMSLIY